ncbi:MAG: AI-2E family transporter [Myxococcota bacterium]|nr:AI-2E family transporter [Myxococcota bacterium]
MPDDAPVRAAADDARRRLLLHVGVPVAVVAVAYLLREILTPIAAALFLAYALSPIVDRLHGRRVPRSVGSVLALAAVAGVLVAVLLGPLPAILGEFRRFAEGLPGMLDRFADERLPAVERALGVDLPDDTGSALAEVAAAVRSSAPDIAAPVAEALARAMGGIAEFVAALFSVLVVPILAYFLLRDFPRLVESARAAIPERLRPGVESYAAEVDAIVAAYLRGQVMVVLCLAALYAVGLELVGLRLGAAIGVLAGVLSFVPYAGFALGLSLALLMALVTGEGGWTCIGVAAVFATAQAIESLVLTPLLVGRRLGLGTLWVLVAIMVFGTLLGFLGVLLAVPLAAIFRASARRVVAWSG